MIGEEQSFEERRRQQRLAVSFPVLYKVLDEEGQTIEKVGGTAVNIGGGGLCFRTDEELSPNHVVAAEFRLPESTDEVVAVGRIVWCRPSEGEGFEVGVEFSWLGWRDEAAQQALSDYVQSKKTEE